MKKYTKSDVILLVDEICQRGTAQIDIETFNAYKSSLVELIWGLVEYIYEIYEDTLSSQEDQDKWMHDYLNERISSSDGLFKDGFAIVDIPVILPNELSLGLLSNGLKSLIDSFMDVQSGVVMALAVRFIDKAIASGKVKDPSSIFNKPFENQNSSAEPQETDESKEDTSFSNLMGASELNDPEAIEKLLKGLDVTKMKKN